jgi:hypothetical protein
VKTTKMKLVTATAGAGALLAMGGLTVATSVAEPETPTPGPVVPGEITTGETTVDQTVPPTTPTTSSVEPEITGPAALPPEQEDAK